ncbi:hypothetical protein [Streptomyces violaceus]|uniref:Uncharacterized protein n=1 Tax=Streptomyces violaceus TaxID=1936 RepID=A0ABZ1P1J8_STRVL
MGSVVYVPVGTAVTERDRNAWNSFDFADEQTMFEAFPQGQGLGGHPGRHRPAGPLQIGGYTREEAIYTDPVADAASHAVKAAEASRWDGPVPGDVSDWVLLAD